MDATLRDGDAYLDAFMDGLEFVLLAMRGRMAESRLPLAARERLESFLAEYGRMATAYRERRPARAGAPPALAGPFVAELPSGAAN